jgi:hypothetical protein
MARPVVRISEIAHRIPEAGRIRLGIKSGKGMKSLDTFRFTSPDRTVIEQLADLYGGTAKAWSDPKASPPNQFEVITTAKQIDVYLPRDALSSWYELWSGGGVQRRCDGEVCQVPITTPNGWEMSQTPCICVAKQGMECRPYSRLNVILPAISFRGVWRLETKGWNAMHELPGMTALIENMSATGQLVKAQLGIESRTQMTPAGKRNFVVPKVTLPTTAEEIVSGAAAVTAIAAAPQAFVPALPPAPTAPIDDDIVDAVVVGGPYDDWYAKFFDLTTEHGIPSERFWHAIAKQIGFTEHTMTPDHEQRLEKAYVRIAEGSLRFVGFGQNDQLLWQQ